MNAERVANCARLVNLVIPGGGLILVGGDVSGVLIALLFTATASFSVAASLLLPGEVPATWRGLGIGVTLGTYVGAQVRFAQTLYHQRGRIADQARRAALHDARQALLDGQVEDAWRALQPLADQADTDLVLAYRVAQVLTARGDEVAARAAWQRVRRLDRHRIYRPETVACERTLSAPSPPAAGSDSPNSSEA